MSNDKRRGAFTLPGEAGYEDLTIRLAEKWGADVIRDSDGTVLSDRILSLGYDIYSTLCLVRADNAWAKENRSKLQQNYLMSDPVTAESDAVVIRLLDGYFREQFVVNAQDDPHEWWQAFDRTTGAEVPHSDWSFDAAAGTVTIRNASPWHRYTVNFLVFRIWEEISMYNHITNDWGDREHLMSVDPIHPETQAHLLTLLEAWLLEHPQTNVVRFTSMFYNFCWFWGDSPDLRFRYSDWASYDFTVSPASLRAFEREHGWRPTSELFVNRGYHNATHNPPTGGYRAWMDFMNRFVVDFGRQCIDVVHRLGRKAYVFYDDHWVGVEPNGERFAEFGFDGVIKCVFNGFEARLCAGIRGAATHELRLHPYLFPTGLTGEPTFKEGGDPALDARKFWIQIRRALLRAPVERIGLGGYLHLVEDFPDFVEAVAEVADEFRGLMAVHAAGKPFVEPYKVGVLTAWGQLRAWTTSGHMHEHPELALNHVHECLAGLPVEVCHLSLDEVRRNGVPADVKVLVNAGAAGSAWSGGDAWADPELAARLTEWVAAGGGFVGIGEPTAADAGTQFFQLGHVLGVDRETGRSICRPKRTWRLPDSPHFLMTDASAGDVASVGKAASDEAAPITAASTSDSPALRFHNAVRGTFLSEPGVTVVAADGDEIAAAVHPFGKGRAVYLSGMTCTAENTRLLHRTLAWAAGAEASFGVWSPDNPATESVWFADSRLLMAINNTGRPQSCVVRDDRGGLHAFDLAPFGSETRIVEG